IARDVGRHLPLELGARGERVTQLDLHSLARLGVAKVDLLGNRALSAHQQAFALLGESAAPPDDHDAATLATLAGGRTIGCFQIETPATRAVLRSMPIRGLDDLIDALAIVRPGPASCRAKEAFLRRTRGEAPAP